MLQDLDFLADRIGQLVEQSRQLHAERAQLLARLKTQDAELDALRQQNRRQQDAFESLSTGVASHQRQLDVVQQQAQAEQAELKRLLEQEQAQVLALRRELDSARAGMGVLRDVAGQARDQIGSILMRLPGAVQE